MCTNLLISIYCGYLSHYTFDRKWLKISRTTKYFTLQICCMNLFGGDILNVTLRDEMHVQNF